MTDLLLHVSLPKRKNLNWVVPAPVLDQTSHYMYDWTLPVRKKLRKGTRVFLYGTKLSGKHGLFASGSCEIVDDQRIAEDKEHDWFMLLRHESISEIPIGPEELIKKFSELAPLIAKIERSTLLEFFLLDEDQSTLLEKALSQSS